MTIKYITYGKPEMGANWRINLDAVNFFLPGLSTFWLVGSWYYLGLHNC